MRMLHRCLRGGSASTDCVLVRHLLVVLNLENIDMVFRIFWLCLRVCELRLSVNSASEYSLSQRKVCIGDRLDKYCSTSSWGQFQ